MIKSVLLDLDGTLLLNSDRVFVSAYLELAEHYFRTRLNRDGMGQSLVSTLEAMDTPRDDFATNTAIALRTLANANGDTEEAVTENFDAFYADVYPDLRTHTQSTPTARHLFDALQAANYAVVIATNPVYPAEAIRQRLAWAGLPDDLSAYAFVTTGDNMHFIKPNPAYYAEILARVGVEPDEVVMVGNSETNDILPARKLGLATYRVDETSTLENFYEAVQDGWLNNIQPPPLHAAMIAPELRGNLGALFGLLAEVKPHQWTQHPDPDEWSILQVVHHLLERETNVQRPRLKRILQEQNPFLGAPPTPESPPDHLDPPIQDGIDIAKAFAAERAKTIEWLESLPTDAWKRPAQHSIFSKTTLLEMAHFTAQHDRMHITQICQTLGRCE